VSDTGPVITALLGELTITIGDTEAVVEGPPAPGEGIELPPDPEVLRAWARTDTSGRYRPLPGARTLRGGWRVRFTSLDAMAAGLDAIYPLAQLHLAQWEDGCLEVVGLDEVLRRQSGRYDGSAALSEAGRELAVDLLCRATCVKAPAWHGDQPAGAAIPCPEPCSVLVSLCREAVAWERDRPEPVPPRPEVPFAAFEEPGNELREAYLARMERRT
jgi:hypothetical protein